MMQSTSSKLNTSKDLHNKLNLRDFTITKFIINNITNNKQFVEENYDNIVKDGIVSIDQILQNSNSIGMREWSGQFPGHTNKAGPASLEFNSYDFFSSPKERIT